MEKVTLKTLFPGFSRVVDFLGKTWIYPFKRHQWLLSVTQGNTIDILSHGSVCKSIHWPMAREL